MTVIKINHNAKKSRTFRHNISDDAGTFTVTQTFRLHDSLTQEIEVREVTFNNTPKLTYFLFNFDIDPLGNINPTGLYLKISKHKAVLILDEETIYNNAFFPDATPGKIGKKYHFDTEFIKPIHSEMYFSMPKI